MMAADYRHIGGLRIDLVGTTADFRRFRPPQPLPINHLLGENCGTHGRIGEVGLTLTRVCRSSATALIRRRICGTRSSQQKGSNGQKGPILRPLAGGAEMAPA